MRQIFLLIAFISLVPFVAAYGQDDKPLELAQAAAAIATGNYAIVIGINDYDAEGILDLKYSEADALDIYDVLINNCGYDASHVFLYLDGKDDPTEAERASSKLLRKRFFSLANPDLYGEADTILVYFSGHGACLNGKNYIIPVDGDNDPALAETYNINLDSMLGWLGGSKFKRQVIYIDACRTKWDIHKGSPVPFVEMAFKYGTGMHVLMGTKLGKFSSEDPSLAHGVFTYYLLKGLQGAAADEDGLITVGYVHDYVFAQMAEYSEDNIGRAQIPTAFGEGNYTIPLAVLGGDWEGLYSSTDDNQTYDINSEIDKVWNLMDEGKYDEAIDLGNQIIQKEPNSAKAYRTRGVAFRKKGEYDKAIADHTKAIEIDPDYVYAHNDRGWAYYNKGDNDKAVVDYNKAIEIDPNYALAYNNRGIAYKHKGDYGKAIADYTKAIEIDPNYAAAYNNRGVAYKHKGDYDKAMADHTKAIEIDPDYVSAYINRGIAYKNKGDYDKAIDDYNKAIKIDPNYSIAYNNRGNVYKRKGEYDNAIADYAKAIEINPNYATAYCNRGLTYWDKGDYLSAYDDFCKAVELDPNYTKAREWRQKAYDKINK
jgi:tetratricopeptide (TPR) repeat protein